jgi:hypothetical protein
MPIDMELWNLVQENKLAVIGALIARFDPSQCCEDPIYSPEGEFSSWRFEQWLISAAITYWPRLESGALELEGDAFRMMYGAHPARAKAQSRRRCARPDPDRSRWSQTSEPVRHRDGNAQASLFNAHWYAFIHEVSAPGISYISTGGREIAIAAARSGMRSWPRTIGAGDIYHALAVMCGLTNQDAKS